MIFYTEWTSALGISYSNRSLQSHHMSHIGQCMVHLMKKQWTEAIRSLLTVTRIITKRVMKGGSWGLSPLVKIMNAFGGLTSPLYWVNIGLDKYSTMHLLKEEKKGTLQSMKEKCFNPTLAFTSLPPSHTQRRQAHHCHGCKNGRGWRHG